jgi:hypothetical protein
MLKRMVKSIAHGQASSHRPGLARMWGRSTAYAYLALATLRVVLSQATAAPQLAEQCG